MSQNYAREIHQQPLQAIADVLRETATPEQKQLFRDKLKKIIDEHPDNRDQILDDYWNFLSSPGQS